MKNTVNDLGHQLWSTKNPVNFYVLITCLLVLLVFFLSLALMERLDWGGAFFCFLIFGGITYGYLGRYLARITLYKDRMEVTYFVPWNRPILFQFRSIVSLESLEKPDFFSILRFTRDYAWYRQYMRLCLSNEEGKVCEIKYNIDRSRNRQFLDELQKRLHS